MVKEKWNYGMLEVAFSEKDMPSYEEYMEMVEGKLTEKGVMEPLFSGKINGSHEYWTFVKHKIEPSKVFEHCASMIPSVKNYSHCYHFKRFRSELLSNIMGGKSKYIGIARLPEADEFNDSELAEIMKKLEGSTPFHVSWISKTHRSDRNNTYFFLTGNVERGDIEKHKEIINEQLKASQSDLRFIEKMGHHKSHRKSSKEKENIIKEHMPEDYVDHEFLKEYDYYHWSR